ncbi:MAG TPA: hypothetical protein VEX69_03390 [Candidatus Limnocylindria bacterium]|nr:hypothetical protein [Candidatus Limnocylindria bacterium]
MKRAAVGFRVHSGWAALVALAVTKGTPAVLLRARVHLVETFSYKFRQPYHTAKRLAPDEGRAFVSHVQAEARRLALSAIHDAAAKLEAEGYQLSRCGLLLASGRPLPGLPQILASHALIHTADGELFREALLYASSRCGLESLKIKERDLFNSASQVLHLKANNLQSRVKELGRPFGAPWSQDEKFASLVAWLAMASK